MERQRRGLSITDVANELKISEANLTSIECGEADTLPSQLYFKMFARSYAEHLGIDYARTIEAICEEIGEPLDTLDKQERDDAGDKNGSDSEPTDSDEESMQEPKPDRSLLKLIVWIAGLILTAFAVFLVIVMLVSDDDTAVDADFEQSAEIRTESSENNESTPENLDYKWSDPPTGAPDSLLLSITAKQESWATIIADGDTAIYQTLTPLRQYRVGAKYRLLVSIGVPRVVETSLDGRPVYLANQNTGRISRVEINQLNRDTIGESRPPQPVTRRSTPAVQQIDTVINQTISDQNIDSVNSDSTLEQEAVNDGT